MERSLPRTTQSTNNDSHSHIKKCFLGTISVLMTLLLSACGGGGGSSSSGSGPGGPGGGGSTTTYALVSYAGAGGAITPKSAGATGGSTVVFTVTPNTGYSISSVTGCGGTLSGGSYTTAPVTADCSVTASFSINTYTVSTSAGTGGSISSAATVNYGGTTAITVTPDTGYGISSVTGCGGTLSGNTYTTGTITADCTVTASFAALHTVTATAGTGGSISPTSIAVAEGNSTSFVVTPNSGYAISGVTGCGGTLSANVYTTAAVMADCAVNASFAALPAVSMGNASMSEGNSGTGTLSFTLSLASAASSDITLDYATADGTATGGTACSSGIDYVSASGTVTIPAGSSSATVNVTVCGDTVPESNETFTLTLTDPGLNATVTSATGTITNDDAWGHLNDTGITTCSTLSVSGLSCPQSGYPAQDAEYGRDANSATNSNSDGHAGFSFTKLGADGKPLAIQNGTWSDSGSEVAGTKWSCVQDNVTGLVWEVKTNGGGLRDKSWTYTWYSSTAFTDGSTGGVEDGGGCVDSFNCDTNKYVAAVNASGLCGHSDWRLPTAEELSSILDISVPPPGPTIDIAWFPNTMHDSNNAYDYYWTDSPYSYDNGDSWAISFGDGDIYFGSWTGAIHVRLVRGGP